MENNILQNISDYLNLRKAYNSVNIVQKVISYTSNENVIKVTHRLENGDYLEYVIRYIHK
jgi:hypothetical protein